LYDESDYHLRSICHKAYASNLLVGAATTITFPQRPSLDSELEFIFAHFFYYRTSFIYRFIPKFAAALTGPAIVAVNYNDGNNSITNPVSSVSGLSTGSLPVLYQDLYRSSSLAIKSPWQSNVRALPTWNLTQTPTIISQATQAFMAVTTPPNVSMSCLESADEDLLLSNLAPTPAIAQMAGAY